MVNNIPVNGWPQLKDLEAVQPTLDRLDKIEAWKRTVKEETFTGDDITIENALALPARSLITEINATQDLHGYDKPWAGGAGKNKLQVTATSTTISGVTFTVNSDGSIKANGTATAQIYFTVHGRKQYAEGSYIFNGCTGGANDTYFMYLSDTRGNYSQYNNEISYTVTDTSGETDCTINIRSGVTVNNIMFYPMLRLSTESDATFAPYSNICPISGRTSASAKSEGKNLLNPTLTTTTLNGVTLTNNGDGTYTVNGTAIADTDFTIQSIALPSAYFDRTLKLVGCPSGGSGSTYRLQIRGTSWLDTGSGATASYNLPYTNNVQIRISNGVTVNNKVFKPMLTADLTATYDTFVPYEPPHTVTIQLGTTVYGADINWDTGVMTVKTAKVDLGSFTWVSENSSVSGLARVNVDETQALGAVYYQTPKSSSFKGVPPTAYVAFAYNEIGFSNSESSPFLRVRSEALIGLSDEQIKSYLTGIDFEYALATPTTIQLTPAQLEMLKGYNYITLSDGYGTIELKALTGANWS